MKSGKLRFASSFSARVPAIGNLLLINGQTVVENVLYVKGLKHNLLSVSQLCNQGYDLGFDSKSCTIKKGKDVIANATRTANNLYILEDSNAETCCLFTTMDTQYSIDALN
jgi:hypothetical protein